MTMHSNNNNKSSPLPSNPNPRNSEINNPMRRSFTGNPFPKPSLIPNPRSTFTNTPTNSPSGSDFPKKSSAAGIRDIIDDKENVKDQSLKPSKIRSPFAAPSSKATKNFMSPTISASFKVAESPRKKILSERNETASPILTPTPSSDPKINVRKVTFADPLQQNMLDASLDASLDESSECLSSRETLNDVNVVSDLSFETMNDPLTPKIDDIEDVFYTESSFETVSQQDPDFVNLDPTFKLSPVAASPLVSSMASVLAPLDADPSMPPYDPKTNYLSPRPQFLHYKPKPRMELSNSQRELEEALLSESFSDTEVTEGSQKESDSEEVVTEEEDQVSEESSLLEKTLEAKERPKPYFSFRSKASALILLLLVAFVSISVINSPWNEHNTVLEDIYEAYESSEFPEFARANFDRFSQFATTNLDGLARNLHIWFTKSLSSISELISSVRGSDSLQYFNLTILHEIGSGTDEYIKDISAEHYAIYQEQLQQDKRITTGVENGCDAPEYEEIVLEGQLATMIESEQALQGAEVEYFDAKVEQESDAVSGISTDESIEEIGAGFESKSKYMFGEVLEGQPATMIESEHALQLAEVEYLDAKVEQENDANSIFEVALESEQVLEDQPTTLIVSEHEAVNSEENQTQEEDDDSSGVENMQSSNFEDAEIRNEVCGGGNIETGHALGNDAKLNVVKNDDVDLNAEIAETYTDMYDDEAVVDSDAAIRGNEQQYLLLFAGTIIIAGATFSWLKKNRSKKITSFEEQPKNEFLSEKNKQTFLDKQSLRNGPVELDVIGESCPSEMSSFVNEESSSYTRKVGSEANSVEKKRRNNHNRRESLASSSDYSMGSPSYGSVTVYEKIPKGRGEEEIVTPVRRSSRIRSIATSPV